MCTRVRLGIYLVHNFRGSGEMPVGKEEDDRRGGYFVRYGHIGIRELCRNIEDTSGEIASGM